ncbi:MAG TPA: type II toxin-antitoxin system VapC family toxin [Gemmatimonadales bacterium]
MVIDTSALVAILLEEPEADRLVQAIATASSRQVGAPTLTEAAAVMLARKGEVGEVTLDALLQRLAIEIVPMSAEAAALARVGYRRYGRGVGSPGVLNFGDCLAYGVAMAAGEPLLFKGDDFTRTDVLTASY